MTFRVELPEPDFAEAFQALEADIPTKAGFILELVGSQVIAYLRSLTGNMRPPARKGEPPRSAHPGGWADITGNLALAYAYEVTQEPDGATLTLTNHMEYAAALEAKDGYFVLKGVADRNGPVEEEIRRIAALVAPDWEIRFE